MGLQNPLPLCRHGWRGRRLRGRLCVCNGLMANTGHSHATGHYDEVDLPQIIAGDDLRWLDRLLAGRQSDTADDLIDQVLRAYEAFFAGGSGNA